MSDCRYCGDEVLWVPTVEGPRPYQSKSEISPDSPVVVLDRHDCAARAAVLKQASTDFMRGLYDDPLIVEQAMTVACERCSAPPRDRCHDLRKGREDFHTKHPHEQRLIAGARLVQKGLEA